jgi:hypothetical protein
MPAFTVSAADFLRRVQYFHFCFLESLLAVVASFVSDPLIYGLTTRLTNSTVSYNVASQPNRHFYAPSCSTIYDEDATPTIFPGGHNKVARARIKPCLWTYERPLNKIVAARSPTCATKRLLFHYHIRL